MKNVYKALLETIPIFLGILALAAILGFDVTNPILDTILFYAIWGKSYQYWTEVSKTKKYYVGEYNPLDTD